MNNIVVIFGGKSTEHEISILSAMQVLENLDKSKYNIIPIYIDKNGEWWSGKKLCQIDSYKKFNTNGLFNVTILPNSNFLYKKKLGMFAKFKKIDCVLTIMHGFNGEDGTLQGLLELSNIPYTSSGVLASSVGMSKLLQKNVFESIGLSVVPYVILTKTEYLRQNKKIKLEKFLCPVIVKPNSLGSSIGVSICKKQKELVNALDLAFKFDEVVIIEKFVKNLTEVNISVMGDKTNIQLSETEQPQTASEFLDFNSKYLSGSKGTKCSSKKVNSNGLENLSRIIPAKISENTRKQIYDYAKKIFLHLNCKGVIRIDFILDKNKKLYVNEVNTIPGSLAYYLWKPKGIGFNKLLDTLINIAIKDVKEKQKIKLTLDNQILK